MRHAVSMRSCGRGRGRAALPRRPLRLCARIRVRLAVAGLAVSFAGCGGSGKSGSSLRSCSAPPATSTSSLSLAEQRELAAVVLGLMLLADATEREPAPRCSTSRSISCQAGGSIDGICHGGTAERVRFDQCRLEDATGQPLDFAIDGSFGYPVDPDGPSATAASEPPAGEEIGPRARPPRTATRTGRGPRASRAPAL